MHRPFTLRLTSEEARALQLAAETLGCTLSALFQSSIIDAALHVGMPADASAPPLTPPAAWPDAPRRVTNAAVRITVSLDPLSERFLTTAARYLGISRAQFAVGAALRYVATLRRPRLSPLAQVTVPMQYRSA